MAWSGLVVALVASAVFAQQPKGPGRGAGFGYGGGLGGMAAFNTPLSLLDTPEVRKEIGLSEEQAQKVSDLQRETLDKLREGGGNRGDFQNLSPEERAKRVAEIQNKAEAVHKGSEEKLAKIVDEKQLARLRQLRLQREGTMALGRPEVAQELGLTDEQQEKVKKIRQEIRPEGPIPGRDASEEERQDFFAKLQKRIEKAQADALHVLTDAQKAKWGVMKGKQFRFPQPTFGPGMGKGGKGKGGEKGPPKKAEE
jgi:hypothetical protein